MDPIKATLTKQRIGAIMDRIKAGEPVEPESSVWSLVDCLMVAGALLSNAMSAGAHVRSSMSEGQRGSPRILKDLQASIEFIGATATAYDNGSWDEFFEPSITIGIRADGGVTPLSGFKR